MLVKQRRLAQIGVVLTAAVAIGVAMMFRFRPAANEPTVDFPGDQQVENVTVAMYNSPWDAPDVPRFTVAPEHIATVLCPFRPVEITAHPRIVREVGKLEITHKESKRKTTIKVYFFGKSPLMYSVDGVECIRGGVYKSTDDEYENYIDEASTFNELMREVRVECVTGKKSESLEELIEYLKKSAGRR